MKSFFLLILTLSLSVSALSADGISNGGKIVHVASVDGAILFSISGNSQSNRPSCASTHRFSAKKDSSHAVVVLTAFATGKTLGNVRGRGACTLWGNSEDIQWIEISP